MKNWESVLRGGVGLFYDLGGGSFDDPIGNFPYYRQQNLFGAPFPLPAAQAQIPPFVLGPVDSSAFLEVPDPHLKLPRVYQWNVAAEQSLGSSQVLSLSYVAAVGRRLTRRELMIPAAGETLAITRNNGISDYHAMQAQFKRRMSHGLQALASYTWSHSIDNASTDSGAEYSNAVEFANPMNDRGASSFDVRHSFNAALTYDIPRLTSKRLGQALLGGWSVDTVFSARSSLPVDLRAQSIYDPTSGAYRVLRPDLVLGKPLYLYGSQCATAYNLPECPGGKGFNGAAFTDAAGSQGTLGRNVLRGFSVWQDDFAIRRQFNLGERVKLQFRSEFFNVLNHPNFGDPDGYIHYSDFGRATRTLARSLGSGQGGAGGGFSPLYQIGGPRSIQLAMKLVF